MSPPMPPLHPLPVLLLFYSIPMSTPIPSLVPLPMLPPMQVLCPTYALFYAHLWLLLYPLPYHSLCTSFATPIPCYSSTYVLPCPSYTLPMPLLYHYYEPPMPLPYPNLCISCAKAIPPPMPCYTPPYDIFYAFSYVPIYAPSIYCLSHHICSSLPMSYVLTYDPCPSYACSKFLPIPLPVFPPLP